MCFSATASFATSGLLLPIGIHCLRKQRDVEPGYGPIAAFPLLFGIQQAMEGLLWLSLDGSDMINWHAIALGYLFFAYFLWPFFVPLAAWRIEHDVIRRRVFLLIGMLGLVFGALLYVPLLLNPENLQFRLVQGSILYERVLLYDAVMPRWVVRLIYALLVALPLVSSGVREVRLFGALVLISVIASALLFEYAFVSIWCFFAALISVYIMYLLHSLSVRSDVRHGQHSHSKVRMRKV